MPCALNGPCTPFITESDICCLAPTGTLPDPCLTTGQPVPQSVIDNSILAASELLWAETGRRYGTCEVTIRPCKKGCGPCDGIPFIDVWDLYYGFSFPYYPFRDNGVWVNIPPCGCADECFCRKAEQIPIPYPTCEILEVEIDGVLLDPGSYRVDEFKWLVRTDGEKWPRCQSAADLGEPDTFGVTLTYGRPVPELLKLATAELACQFIRACVGAPCDLPNQVTTITRQGVTMGFIDPGEFFRNRQTGIRLVDIAIQTFNPHRITRRPTVYSPDVGSKWRRTDT